MAQLKKRALLSVSDKTGIIDLAKTLVQADYEIISTGGTAQLLSENGIQTTGIEAVTNFPECMDGRLKTLHPAIFGGLLAVYDNPAHVQTMTEQNIGTMDVLVVNLYPFRKTVEDPAHTLQNAIEQIDVGGPSMIRAAAKNHKFVTVLTSPAQYQDFTDNIADLNQAFRYKLAVEAFRYTAAYDAYISDYLGRQLADEIFPETLTLTFDKQDNPMRYGENPHQEAAYFSWPTQPVKGIESATLLGGKPLSYNNIADSHAALQIAREFGNDPVCVAVKHATPCGVAIGVDILAAYTAAYDCDPQSIFGGIICLNRPVDVPTATKMAEIFLEVIIAPSFDEEALKILKKKKNLRLLALPEIVQATTPALELKSVGGGILVQQADANQIDDETLTTVTKTAPTKLTDLRFAMKVVKHVKSNAIVIAKNGCTLGLGGGETSRIWAAEAAVARAGERAKGAVLASDAMFPFPDVVELAAKAGIVEIIQPGGSINDKLSVEACDNHGIAMVMTGVRHFKH